MLLAAFASAQSSQGPANSHIQRAVDLLRNQDFVAALPELEQADRAHPNSPEIQNLIGITETQLTHLPQAEAHYRKAIALNPNLPRPHKI